MPKAGCELILHRRIKSRKQFLLALRTNQNTQKDTGTNQSATVLCARTALSRTLSTPLWTHVPFHPAARNFGTGFMLLSQTRSEFRIKATSGNTMMTETESSLCVFTGHRKGHAFSATGLNVSVEREPT
jgi:hypothetical protein